MTGIDKEERKYIHGAFLLIVQIASDLETVRELVDHGRQVLVMIPSRMLRSDCDALTGQLMDLVDGAEAKLTAVQVGSARPKGWRKWLSRLNATRTFMVTPKTLDDPSVAVFWATEADTGVERLVVGELKAINAGFIEA